MADLTNSLQDQLAAATDLREKVDLMNALAWELRHSDLQRAISLCEQASELASPENGQSQQPYLLGLGNSLHNLGRFNLWLAKFDVALAAFSKSLETFQALEDPAGIALQLSYLGVVYGRSGHYAEGLQYMLKAYSIFENLGDTERQAERLNDIGYTYVMLSQYEKALPYFRQSLEIFRDIDNKRNQATVLDSLANAYLGLGDCDSALDAGLKSVELCQEIGEPLHEAEHLLTVGRVYQAQNTLDEAIKCFQRSLRTSQDFGYQREAAHALRILGDIYHQRGETELARSHLHHALTIAQEIGAKQEIFQCHQGLAQVYKQAGAFEQALHHSEQFHDTWQVVFNAEADTKLKTLEILHQVETARKEAEIYQLRNISLTREIQDRQQAERALQLANNRLRQEIAERELLIADLNSFAHTVAHDLKSPLHLITGYSEFLMDKLSQSLDRESDCILAKISRTGRKMSYIIDELLILASVRQQKIVLEPIDTTELVSEVLDRLNDVIIEKQAEIIIPDAWPQALGYAPWIEEVWVNYISNAIKYGGQPPRVELGSTPQPDGYIRFWVRDNGGGVSPADQNQLFTLFTRLSEAQIKGHGLGLSIVKRIVERLGGEVAIESEGVPGRGSTFSFTLPTVDQ
jgi:signal transduction histidine kinase